MMRLRRTLVAVVATLLSLLLCIGYAGAERVLIGVTGIEVASNVLPTVKGQVVKDYPRLNLVIAEVPTEQMAMLTGKSGVRYVEKNAAVRKLGDSQTITWGVDKIGAPLAWPISRGKGVHIAVLDTGIDGGSYDLRVAGGYRAEGVVGDALTDVDGHGTHVAGTISAQDNKVAMVGVAPEAELYSVKVLDDTGSGSVESLIDGIYWAATHQMQVLNMSLGTTKDSQALREACQFAYDNGLLLVAAAGNKGNRSGSSETVEYPAAYPTVLAVGAVDQADVRASFSATGSALDIMAPGVEITSMLPGNQKGYSSGTSAAAPHVSGVAALIWAINPLWNNAQVQERLLATALRVGNGDPSMYGRGRVDAAAAVGTKGTSAQPAASMQSKISVNPDVAVMGDVVSITVSVKATENGKPITSANVSMSVRTPSGSSFVTPGYTDANGNAHFRLRTRSKDGIGTYSLRVQVSKTGFADCVTEASFTVR